MAASQWRLIASLIRPHRRAMSLYGATLAAATAVPLLGSLALARFVRLSVESAPATDRALFGLAYAACGVAASAMTILVTWRATALAWAITNGLRHELADYVLHADLAFHRDRTPGELVTRVDGDINAMTQFLGSIVSRVVAIVALGVAGVGVMAFIEPALAPFLLVGVAGVGLVTWAQRDSATNATVAERAAEAELMSVTEQYLAGAEDVASLGAGAYGVARAGDVGAQLVERGRGRVRVQMRVQTVIRIALSVAEALVIGAGAFLLRRGSLDVAAVVLGYRFVSVLTRPIEQLTWRLQEAQGATGAARRVLDFLAEGRDRRGGTVGLPSGPIRLTFDQVELVYDDSDDETRALEELSLIVEPGRVLGLVGRSGSGKTSIARLVLGLVGPTRGHVRINGVDVIALDELALRRRVTAVPQDVQLFPGTVRDNVAMFEDAPDDEIRAALDDVGLGPWLAALPEGLDARLTADGRDDESGRTGLSAGEAQLLSLARAVLRRPDLVVLDEATSRVDPETQHAIAAAVARLLHGRTGVVIAHRLETLDICDDIAVLAGGRLVEHGDRRQLLADRSSRYSVLRNTAVPMGDGLDGIGGVEVLIEELS